MHRLTDSLLDFFLAPGLDFYNGLCTYQGLFSGISLNVSVLLEHRLEITHPMWFKSLNCLQWAGSSIWGGFSLSGEEFLHLIANFFIPDLRQSGNQCETIWEFWAQALSKPVSENVLRILACFMWQENVLWWRLLHAVRATKSKSLRCCQEVLHQHERKE